MNRSLAKTTRENVASAADATDAARRQNVVGSGDVVAHRLRSGVADEDRARVLDPLKVGSGVNGEMLRRKAVS